MINYYFSGATATTFLRASKQVNEHGLNNMMAAFGMVIVNKRPLLKTLIEVPPTTKTL